MNNKPVFSINNISVGRDNYIAENMIINQSYDNEDISRMILDIQYKVNEFEINKESKRKINGHLEEAKTELENKNPDKKSIGENIKKTIEILKEVKTKGETLKDVGVLIGKLAAWMGTTAAKLGWIF